MTTQKRVPGRGKDIYLSAVAADASWAGWLAGALERSGRSVIRGWEQPQLEPDLASEMEHALRKARRVLAVLTPAYLEAHRGALNRLWLLASVSQPPFADPGRLLPVMVEACRDQLVGFLPLLPLCDLSGLTIPAIGSKLGGFQPQQGELVKSGKSRSMRPMAQAETRLLACVEQAEARSLASPSPYRLASRKRTGGFSALPALLAGRTADRTPAAMYSMPGQPQASRIAGPADVYLSASSAPLDRALGESLAALLQVLGQRVVRLWREGSGRPELDVEEAGTLMVVFSRAYMSEHLPEWGAFSRSVAGYRGHGRKRLVLVVAEGQDDFSAAQSTPELEIVAIDLRTGSGSEKQARVIAHLGLAEPAGLPQMLSLPAQQPSAAAAAAAASSGKGGYTRRVRGKGTGAGAAENTCPGCGLVNRRRAKFCADCGAPLVVGAPSPRDLPATTLLKKRYRILQVVGRGGFAAVYKAADTDLGNRPVAVKEMSVGAIPAHEVAAAVATFKQEALMLAGLTHPNLPAIYEHFREKGRWYLVMQFIEGETLEDYLKRVGLPRPVDEALDIAIVLATVLGFLHGREPQPIIFRDLKPLNVMRTLSGHLYLIDFGIARHFKPGQDKDTVALGSTGYAAPEQYGKAQTTPRSDIYALGATLHQLLTGMDPSWQPFFFREAQELNPLVGSPLSALVVQMLQMESDRRPDSMAAIKEELVRIKLAQASGAVSGQAPVMPGFPQPGGQQGGGGVSLPRRPSPVDLQTGRDDGPMDLYTWVGQRLFRPGSPYSFFDVSRRGEVLHYEGNRVFVLFPRWGTTGQERYEITSLLDADLTRLAKRLHAPGDWPDLVQGTAMADDPRTTIFSP